MVRLLYFKCSTGIEIKIKDLAFEIANQIGFKGDIFWDDTKPDGTPRKLLNIDKIKNGLGAKISKEGIGVYP